MTQPLAGLADRLRGIVSLYYVAKLFNRSLLLSDELFGGKGQQYVIPNDEPGGPNYWAQPDASGVVMAAGGDHAIHYSVFNSLPGTFSPHHDSFQNFSGACGVVDVRTNSMWIPDLLASPHLQRHPMIDELRQLDQDGQVWHHALKALFRPGPRIVPLLQQIDVDFLLPGTFKIGLHVRTGDLKFGETAVNDFSKVESAPCFATKALTEWLSITSGDRAEHYPGGLVIFMTSDDPEILAILNSTLTNLNFTNFFTADHYSPGGVRHIAFSEGEDQTRTFLDWFLFTRMDLIIATPSGFSASASRYACTPILTDDVGHQPSSDCQRWRTYGDAGLCQPSASLFSHVAK